MTNYYQVFFLNFNFFSLINLVFNYFFIKILIATIFVVSVIQVQCAFKDKCTTNGDCKNSGIPPEIVCDVRPGPVDGVPTTTWTCLKTALLKCENNGDCVNNLNCTSKNVCGCGI
jgi:hypothetical protein